MFSKIRTWDDIATIVTNLSKDWEASEDSIIYSISFHHINFAMSPLTFNPILGFRFIIKYEGKEDWIIQVSTPFHEDTTPEEYGILMRYYRAHNP